MPKATGPVYDVPFRRRRDRLTNYARRLALVKSGVPRLVVRKSGRRVTVQLVSFANEGDKVIASADSAELKKFGWSPRSNLPSAYLAGALAAKKGAKAGAKAFVLDTGLSTASKSSLVFAAAKGAIDAGLKGSMDKGLVDEKRISGAHIAEYAGKLKEGGAKGALFSSYEKDGVKPEKIPELFAAAKDKVLKGGA
jgi:large subunit ribosomal protein L18